MESSLNNILVILCAVSTIALVAGRTRSKRPSKDNQPPVLAVEENVYRLSSSKDKLVDRPVIPRLNDNELTLLNMFHYNTKTYANRPCLGWRDITNIHTVRRDGKNLQLYELTDYRWMTFGEMGNYVTRIGNALLRLGIRPGEKILFYSKTSYEWQLMAQACFCQNIVVATAYDSMDCASVEHILKQTKAVAIFTDVGLLKTTNQILQKRPALRAVIYSGYEVEDPSGLKELKEEAHGSYEVVSVEELRKEDVDEHEAARAPTPQDIACIMYT
ncbi:uncharacterized protein VTP21DRAFT_99 [Calcarisporiella thermophila]|uniref:uncharacterized protein n=1 Tax=Calcarisporiella thermophila TaxID=911321 RepID=UPI0037437FBC